MSKVHRLPDNLVSRIAAGEVVERPASVLKELVENSLDAGAKRVQIQIQGAGRTLLRIADDGCGLSSDDAKLALERHATSKISSFDDLENLSTFGFRGEALPSIAAVSRFTLTTREASSDSGWSIQLEGGKVVSEKPVARESGTTMDVRDLFFNTPARFKFLKSDSTERAQCLRVLEEAAFAALGVEFSISAENAKPVTAPATSDLKSRIKILWGGSLGESGVPVKAGEKHFSVSGIVSSPDGHTATARQQILFVNRRPVTNRRLTRAVYDAFLGQLPMGRHPSWVLFLEVNPQSVDVNVHPSKREVKLAFEGEIFGFLLNAVKLALGQSSGPTLLASFGTGSEGARFDSRYRGGGATLAPSEPVPGWGKSLAAGVETLYQPSPVTSFVPELAPLRNQTFRAAAQIANMFIVAESPEGLVIIDQHAAAEKILYEKLMAEKKSASPKTQMLLVPFSWEVAVSLVPLVRERLPALQKFGFAIEFFGGTTFLVKGYPSDLGERFDLLTMLDSLTDTLSDPADARGGHEKNFDHRVAAMAACKGSVRAGDPLDLKSCQALLDQLVRLDAPHTCPHGRPTIVQMSLQELERRFRRI